MTSKNLYFSLIKDEFKKKIWQIALYSLIFFIVLPIVIALQVSSYSEMVSNTGDSYTVSYSTNFLTNYIGLNFSAVSFFTIVFAIISGLSSFHYLHSKKKIDLYHSLPIKRETTFIVNYITGVIIYAVPYIINLILTYIVIGINGHFTSALLMDSIKGFAVNGLFYIVLYSVVTLASILTGHLVVAFLMTCVHLGYGLLLMGIQEIVISEFFRSYSRLNAASDMLIDITPIYNYVTIFEEGKLNGIAILKLVITLVIVFALSFYSFKKRPSEAAGKAIAFQFVKPLLKVLVIIPVSLMGGYLFGIVSNSNTAAWNIFGVAFVAIVGSIIMEMIYYFDVKSGLRGKKALLLSLLVAYGVGTLFKLNILDLNKKIPNRDKVESVAIQFDSLDSNINYYYQAVNYDNRNGFRSYNRSEFKLNNMELNNIDTIYKLAEEGIKNSVQSSYIGKYISYDIKFQLKNGKEVYRTYHANLEDIVDEVTEIYNTKEYKEVSYPILSTLTDKVVINSMDRINVVNLLNYARTLVSNEDKDGLLEAYRKDIMDETLEDKINGKVLAMLTTGGDNAPSNEYYILDSHVNTITYLERMEYAGLNSLYDIDNITEVIVYDYSKEQEAYELSHGISEAVQYVVDSTQSFDPAVTITDRDKITSIMNMVVLNEYYYSNQAVISSRNNRDIRVVYNKSDSGERGEQTFILKSEYDSNMYNLLKSIE